PEALVKRTMDQDSALDAGATFAKVGGRLVYVTCSVLPEEDEDRVAAFLARTDGTFAVRPATTDPELTPFLTAQGYLRLTPASADTDGFFVAVLERAR
ncbi:MAG TPA: MFS transporter, partial [Phenylobacterium sp.]|nr:MFS transporter [Phenylobacterium sp.]